MNTSRYNYNRLGFAHWLEPFLSKYLRVRHYNRLGFAHWLERKKRTREQWKDYNRLGFAHWLERVCTINMV